MPSRATDILSALRRDQRGTVAILFALTLLPVFLTVGLAIDGARGYYTRTKIAAVLDAAALATAKTMRDRDMTDAEVIALASNYVTSQMRRDIASRITADPVAVTIDRTASSIRLDLTAHVVNYFGPIAGKPAFEVAETATALFGAKQIELGMMLDVSGSMADDGKIGHLKDAMATLLDIMMPGTGTTSKVKIGIAPFSTSVNAGDYAGLVKAGNPAITCVSERKNNNAHAFTDAAPTGGNKLGNKAVWCPTAKVLALTDQKSVLTDAVQALTPAGNTAGHLGTAWAWYLISPEWAGIWPAQSQPKAYSDRTTIKSVVLMTDGMFNMEYERPDNGSSADQARSLCTNMKDKGIIVYTIGFQVPPEARPVLQACATSPTFFFDAQDGGSLSAAFAKIAADLTQLRLTQ